MKTAEEMLKTELNIDRLSPLQFSGIIKSHEKYADQFKPKWISVEERLPEPNKDDNRLTKYVWCLTYSVKYGTKVLPFNPHHICWDDEDCDDHYSEPIGGKVTHWMPLPTKP